jgi:DNA replication and repair protein RecF
MLQIQTISLFQFKNYTKQSFVFNKRIIGICGKNGVGKTNLLDAIHYLCFTKSYFTRIDGNNVKQGAQGFRLEGSMFLNNQLEKAVCILRESGKKEFSVNEELYDKFSQHIGRYPCVVIAPDDAELITGDSKERRTFIDTLLCQLDADYLKHLIFYKKILEQRNSLLKLFVETGQKNLALLEVLDQQLIQPCTYIFLKRKSFFQDFIPAAVNYYSSISNQPENVSMSYESELHAVGIAELLIENRNRDLLAQRTTSGIHKDDLDIQLNDLPFKNNASQGQRKSLLFALKLTEMDILKKEKGLTPLLLLDDVFEKLDEDRIKNLLKKVCAENEGQVFITDTNKKRLKEKLEQLSVSFELIELTA